jgi:predicted permease
MALRALWRNRLYSVAVVLLLGLGTGASTLIFSCIDAFLLRPLPVVNPERLVRFGVYSSATHVNFEHSSVYARVIAGHARSFESVLTFWPLDAAFVSGRETRTITCEAVSDNYFAALGLRPVIGTFFSSTPGEALPAVLSYGFWQEAFGGRRDVLGSGVRIRGAPFTIVGVGPAKFGGLDLERRADVWVPPRAWSAWTGKADTPFAPAQILMVLKDKVTLSQAESEIRVLYPSMVDADLAGQEGVTNADIAEEKGKPVTLVSAAQGASSMRKQIAAAAPALKGGIGALLLLVAAGVGALMRVRAEARTADTAVRLSLGASRSHIVRSAMAEALLLATAAAVLAAIVDVLWGPFLTSFLPARQPRNLELRPDMAVLAFTFMAAASAALTASIAPVLVVIRTDLIQSLGAKSGRVTGSAFGRSLVAIQVALATMLIAGSLGLVRSLAALRKEDPGFDRAHLIVAGLDARMAGVRREQVPGMYREILRRARELPGAVDASLSGAPLMRGVGLKNTIAPAGSWISPQDRLNVSLNSVTETHFQNLGMRIIAGRNVSPSDLELKPHPVIVTEGFASEFFPHVDPLWCEFRHRRSRRFCAARLSNSRSGPEREVSRDAGGGASDLLQHVSGR